MYNETKTMDFGRSIERERERGGGRIFILVAFSIGC